MRSIASPARVRAACPARGQYPPLRALLTQERQRKSRQAFRWISVSAQPQYSIGVSAEKVAIIAIHRMAKAEAIPGGGLVPPGTPTGL